MGPSVPLVLGYLFPSLAWGTFLQIHSWSPFFCESMDCSSRGFSIHGVFQARILEWVAISSSRGSSPARDRTHVSCIEGRRFTLWATREVRLIFMESLLCNKRINYISNKKFNIEKLRTVLFHWWILPNL